MIKGVSKQILEVTNTDNPYFDKIIFFVKPEHQSTDRKKLQKEAEAVAALKQKPPRLKLTKKQINCAFVVAFHHGRVRNNLCYFIISIGEKQYDSI